MRVLERLASQASPQASVQPEGVVRGGAHGPCLSHKEVALPCSITPPRDRRRRRRSNYRAPPERQQVGGIPGACMSPVLVSQDVKKVTAFIPSFLLSSSSFPGGGRKRTEGKGAMSQIRGILSVKLRI